nr:hypothetical protein [Tanacetum cinerariifolium]
MLIAWKPDTVCTLIFVQKIFIAFQMAMRSRISVSMISSRLFRSYPGHVHLVNGLVLFVADYVSGAFPFVCNLVTREYMAFPEPPPPPSTTIIVVYTIDKANGVVEMDNKDEIGSEDEMENEDEAENDRDETENENDEDEAENENDGDEVEAEARVLRICLFDLTDLEKSHISVWIMNEVGGICEWNLVIHVHAGQLIEGNMIKSLANRTHVWVHLKRFAGLPNSMPSMSAILNSIIPFTSRRTTKSVIAKLVIAASAYYIWQERNDRLFKNSKRSVNQIIECVMNAVRLKLLSCRLKKSKDEVALAQLWKISDSIFQAS